MSTDTFIAEHERTLRFAPIAGIPNAVVVEVVPGAEGVSDSGEMNAAEWDKFERDIAEAFERVP